MSSLLPRAVLVTRQTEFDRLIASHATRGQAEFFLKSRNQSLKVLEERHMKQTTTVEWAKRAVPEEWTTAEVLREDLDRFLFAANDIVIAIGQDGLVANLAKYLEGQPVLGVTPDPEWTEGALTSITVDRLPGLLPPVAAGDIELERRSMVEARLEDGQKIAALNELFIGHRSHQSARYLIRCGKAEEFQSSSGVIISTGTGLTGWARSILTATRKEVAFGVQDRRAVHFTREPWPSRHTGCSLSFGEISEGEMIELTSRMNEGGVIFADGIEQDFLRFDWGVTTGVALSSRTMNLVTPS
ncbi:MAG: hypothetical protein ABJN26_08435 [Stappiaceae bacterium]